MAEQLGPIDESCDSPPYSVVTACRRVGIQEPEDVRWCRLNRVVDAPASEWAALRRQPWKLLVRLAVPGVRRCSCGQRLPGLDRYTFTFRTGREASYLLGQCASCRTVYWEEA